MRFSLVSLQRWSLAHPVYRWWAMVLMALAVLFGTTPGVREDIEEATEMLTVVVLDETDYEPHLQARAGQKGSKASTVDKRSAGGGDKLDVPPGVIGRVPPLHLAQLRGEPPHEPPSRHAPVPQPERLLRPPNA